MPITPAEGVGISGLVIVTLGVLKLMGKLFGPLIDSLVGRYNGRGSNGRGTSKQNDLCRHHAERVAKVETSQQVTVQDVEELRGELTGMRDDVHRIDKKVDRLLMKAGLPVE